MKKILCGLLIFMYIFCIICINSCTKDRQVQANTSIDTASVVLFTDNLIKDNGYDILKKSISQHTNSTDKFLVEYWWREDNNCKHYGYYVQQLDSNNYIESTP